MGMTQQRSVRQGAGMDKGRQRPGRKKQKAVLGPREKRRVIQLVVCLALFLTVFIGKGIFPQRVAALRDQVLVLLRGDTDFQAVFSDLGQSISQGEPVLDSVSELWIDAFGGQLEETDGTGENTLYAAQVSYLSGFPGLGEAGMLGSTIEAEAAPTVAATPAPQPENTPEPTPTTESEPEVEHVNYDGPALPENTSMDKYYLNLEETVTPVMGWLSSPFGWREHPVDGEEKFHNGVDLAVNTGTQVLAFADGTIDYIGDSPEYGLYLQISHANGVKSFYAHCSELLVHQGQTVQAGETVALSGNTGNSTGPHLHLELKIDGVRINPIYYIETN